MCQARHGLAYSLLKMLFALQSALTILDLFNEPVRNSKFKGTMLDVQTF